MTAGAGVLANALIFLLLMTIMVLLLLFVQVLPVPGMRLLLTPNGEPTRSLLLDQVQQIRPAAQDSHCPPRSDAISEGASMTMMMMTTTARLRGARLNARRIVLATKAELEATSSPRAHHHHHHPSVPKPRPNLREHAFSKLDPGGGRTESADNCRRSSQWPATANMDHCSPSPEGEIDPRYGVEKRLVPTGPNPLHN